MNTASGRATRGASRPRPTLSTRCRWHRTCSLATSPRWRPTACGPATLPLSRPAKAGCTWLSYWICSIARWSVGRSSPGMTADIVTDALAMAWFRRKPPAGVLFHSDRGSQYASQALCSKRADYGMTASMSRKGNCWDNAPSESFFNSLKNERVHGTTYATRAAAEADLFRIHRSVLQPESPPLHAGLIRRLSSFKTGFASIPISTQRRLKRGLLESEKRGAPHIQLAGNSLTHQTTFKPNG
ncbi:MAG: DDE-type integrase/transposase/recombinase [Candidatus Competibacteraceae bacterium]|nr:DDE-type integrase/transposase/recombinase [Candidatus Competibacteraceae bacterium]